MNSFFQDGPQLKNQYTSDHLLQSFLRWRVPGKYFNAWEPQLKKIGERVVGDILEMARDAENNLPKHIPFDPWGRRIDQIAVSHGWENLDKVSAEEGLIATAYERASGEYSRTHQFAMLYLFHPSSAFYSCPLAMTDGAARAIELYGNEELKSGAFKHLTSKNPK